MKRFGPNMLPPSTDATSSPIAQLPPSLASRVSTTHPPVHLLTQNNLVRSQSPTFTNQPPTFTNPTMACKSPTSSAAHLQRCADV